MMYNVKKQKVKRLLPFAINHKSEIIKFFTLLELVCVLTISLVIIGIVIGRVGKTPAFISLDSCVNKVQGVLFEASNQSIINGKKIVIQFRNRQFSPKSTKSFTKSTIFKKYITYTVPEAVTVSFPNLEEDNDVSFIFFPNGSASAPKMQLDLKKHSAIIKISKLTGIVNVTFL